MPLHTKRRVALIGTGGTISSIGRDSLDLWEYMDAGRKAEPDELLTRFPEAAEVADVVCVRFRAMSSPAIGPSDWLALTAAVDAAVVREAPLDGVVITHGTATLEETAYFLNLTLKVDATVVLVGSQRPATGLSSDAGLNLLNALRVAGAPAARGLGVLVLLNDEVQAAREVTKTSTLASRRSGARTLACSATRIRTVASPSTDGRHDATHRGRSSTCAAVPTFHAWTSRRRMRGPTAPPSRPSWRRVPAPSSRRRCRRA